MRIFPRAILHCSSRVTAIVSHDTSATSGRKRKTRVPIPHGTIIKYIAKNKKKIAHVNKHVLNTIMLSFLLHNSMNTLCTHYQAKTCLYHYSRQTVLRVKQTIILLR